MRMLLRVSIPVEAGNAAAKAGNLGPTIERILKHFEIVYRRSVPRLGHNQAIGAIAHRQCRLIWLILHQGVNSSFVVT